MHRISIVCKRASAESTAPIDVPTLVDKETPVAMPNKSTTAIDASPLAVISPIFSRDPSRNELYSAVLVEEQVNMLICLQQLAVVAKSKKTCGNT